MDSLMVSLGIDRLPETERLQLAEEILESLGDDRELPPLSTVQCEELDRRLARMESGDYKTTPWEEVYAWLSSRLPSNEWKPNRRFKHVDAIVRCDDYSVDVPLSERITVKEIVTDPDFAESEVKRLNELNHDKRCFYFSQLTRFQGAPLASEAADQNERPATGESTA
jgi:putative addiction module component (TIGR02574 family)